MNIPIPSAARALCAAALSVAVCAPAAAADTVVLTATSAAWRVTTGAPSAGWNTSASFDDSLWQSATELYEVSSYLGAGYAAAKGIWSQGGQFSTTETMLWGRTVFDLAVVPPSAMLEYGIDDDGDIFVNGTLVVSDHNGIANGGTADIGAYLVAGANVIAFSATDNFPSWGYNHAAWVQVEGSVAAVPEPSTWAMFALGLGVVGLARLRRRERS